MFKVYGGGCLAHLSLSLFGSFQVTLAGLPLKDFKSNKVRALLVYLAVESDRPHQRETLAGLLWPDWPNRDALSNLRYALSNLRNVIGDRTAETPFLIISRDNIQFNTSSDYSLDIENFVQGIHLDKANQTPIRKIEQRESALALYRGNFLEGFSVDDSLPFEEWTLITRERLARQALSALHTLSSAYEERGELEKAQSFAWRQLELEPWDESAHQSLMRTLALSGKRSAALAQYEACRKTLDEGMGIEPSEDTKTLYERIRTGEFKTSIRPRPAVSTSIANVPAFLSEEASVFEIPVFAARSREMNKLNDHLAEVMDGKGRVVFITGEAGSGKTALIQEFTRRALNIYPELLVASGNCNAYTGMGDPHLPFREILEFLTGDVESRWAVGAISREQAIRLWNSMPAMARALLEVGPDLLDTFVQRSALFERVKASVSEDQDWVNRLGELLDRKQVTALNIATQQQISMFEQYTKVLQKLETLNPILMVIDDLQWADKGSVNLLFHLGRRVSGGRILLLGAYRSEEVALGRDGTRHPLEPLINEFRRTFGDILVNLDQILSEDEGRNFVDEFLDTEPNRLNESFREMLYKQTQGHPLFTIELLRGLQERGDIFKDPEGFWITGSSLNWETLPVRIEAAIQERISRLPKTMQKVLEIACIEGELFTAEVIASVMGIDEREVLECLSGDLDRLHSLVRAQSIQRVNNRLLSRYQFRHILFQRYIYSSLDEVQRAHLHEQVGKALENYYGSGEGAAQIAVRLALHFQIARIDEKVIYYLQLAGDRAMQLSAYHEVITHASHALQLLKNIPESVERDERELALCLTLGNALVGAKGGQIAEVKNTYDRARHLCEKLDKKFELAQVLGGLTIFYYVRGNHHKARELALEANDLAKIIDDPALLMLCNWNVGFVLFCLGEFPDALKYLRQVTEVYDFKHHHESLLQLRNSDAGTGAMAYETCCLWCLGYPDQALRRSQLTLEIGKKVAHPFSLADVHCFAGCLFHSMRRDAVGLAEEAEELIKTADKSSLVGWLATGMRYRGEALVLQGNISESTELIQNGLAVMRSEEIAIFISGTYATLVEAQLNHGLLEDARERLDEAFAFVEETDERYWEAELFRLKGELLYLEGEIAGAEACLNKAIKIARTQKAKSLELRAVIGLTKIWGDRGKKKQAHQMLKDLYDWFSEGFDTADLLAAKALLDELNL